MTTPFFSGYMAQGVGGPGSFTENTASGYAREPVTLTDLRNCYASLALGFTFPCTTSVTVTQRALYDSPTGGNLIMWWNLPSALAFTSAAPDILKAGQQNTFYQQLHALGGTGLNATAAEFAAGAQIGLTSSGLPVYAGVGLEVKNSVVYAANLGAGIPLQKGGSTVTAAASITLSSPITHVTGTSAITSIGAPSGTSSLVGATATLIADSAWSTTTVGGNIASALTATAGVAYGAIYDGAKWYIK